jgi:hypothetical protein
MIKPGRKVENLTPGVDLFVGLLIAVMSWNGSYAHATSGCVADLC